jgi:hypothetical protein
VAIVDSVPTSGIETPRGTVGAAQRPRGSRSSPVGEPPADAGDVAFTLRQPGRQGKRPFAAARRVGSAELLGGNRVSKPVARTHFFGCAWGDVTTGTTRLSAGGVEL